MDVTKSRFALLDSKNVVPQNENSFCNMSMDLCNSDFAFLRSEIWFQATSMAVIHNTGSFSHKQILF